MKSKPSSSAASASATGSAPGAAEVDTFNPNRTSVIDVSFLSSRSRGDSADHQPDAEPRQDRRERDPHETAHTSIRPAPPEAAHERQRHAPERGAQPGRAR